MLELFRPLFSSGWAISVWNCHGTLLPCDYEYEQELRNDPEIEWLDLGYFTIPIVRGFPINEKLKRKIKAWCWKITGPINISGIRYVTIWEMQELEEIFWKYTEQEVDERKIKAFFKVI